MQRVRVKRRKKQSVDYEVEKVLDSRPDEKSLTGEKQYLVKWKGYGDDENTWEPARNLNHAADAIADFESRTQPQPVAVEPEEVEPAEKFVCDLCQEECSNESSLFVHRFHQHGQQVPVDRLAKMNITTNVEVLRQLQRTDPELREIFNTQARH